MPSRRGASVWRLVVPVAIAVLPLSLVAQTGASRTPADDILEQQTYQAPPIGLAGAVNKKTTTDQPMEIR